MTKMFDSFLGLFWRLGTCSRPFDGFDEMAMECDVLVFSRCCSLFLAASVRTFKIVEGKKLIIYAVGC